MAMAMAMAMAMETLQKVNNAHLTKAANIRPSFQYALTDRKVTMPAFFAY